MGTPSERGPGKAVEPFFIARRFKTVARNRATGINGFNDALAVNRIRNGLAKFCVAKPLQFFRIHERLAGLGIHVGVFIEPESSQTIIIS